MLLSYYRNLIHLFLISLFFQAIFTKLGGSLFFYLDDFLFILILPYFGLMLKKDPYLAAGLSSFLIVCIILFFVECRTTAFLKDLLLFIKPLGFFWGFIAFFLYEKKMHFSWTLYIRIFFFSVFYGILQSLAWNFNHIELPFFDGKTMLGFNSLLGSQVWISRVNSFYPHTVWFGLVSSLFGIFGILSQNKKLIVISSIALLISFTRWAIALFGFIAFVHFYIHNPRKRPFLLIMTSVITLTISLKYGQQIMTLWDLFYGNYNSDSTIKLYGIQKGIELFRQNPFGYGLGSYGTGSSSGSFTYNWIHFRSSMFKIMEGASGIESIWTILLIQTGCIGFITYLYPFVRRIKNISKDPSAMFFLFIALLPLISVFYNPLVLALCAFFTVFAYKASPYTKVDQPPSTINRQNNETSTPSV